MRGRKKEVATKRQTVPTPSSQWVRGTRTLGSRSEEGAESLPPPSGEQDPGTQRQRRAHTANQRAGASWVEVLGNPKSGEEATARGSKGAGRVKGAEEMLEVSLKP